MSEMRVLHWERLLNEWVKKAAEAKSVEEFEIVLLHSATDSPES